MMIRFLFSLIVALVPTILWAGTVQIESEKLTIMHKSNQATFTDHVHLTRDDFELYCDRLVAYYNEHELDRAEAFGHIVLHQKDVKGTSDKAILNQHDHTMTLIGHAVLEQKGSKVQGETIVHNMKEEQTTVFPAKGGRTHMTIESDDSGKSMLPTAGKQH